MGRASLSHRESVAAAASFFAGLRARLAGGFFGPTDGASLAAFRILLGALLMYEVWRYFNYHWIEAKFIVPQFLFSYHGFEWVKPFGAQGMFWVFRGLFIFAFLITVGLFYRVAVWGVFACFSYIFLLDKAQYLNHFYFTILLIFVLALTPAHQVWSLDRLLGRVKPQDHVPAWCLFILRAQMEIMLLWAGIVKLNADWLAGRPLVDWLQGQAHKLPETLAHTVSQPEVGILAAWAVAGLHLIGAPLLMWRRTRVYVFWAYVVFHCLNKFFWNIGIFPWLTIAGTTVFFAADWPRRLLGRRGALMGAGALPVFTPRPIISAFVILWVASQALLPVRPYLYSGNVAWNEQGHRFAWRMKLRDKAGRVRFTVHDPATGRRWQVKNYDFLTPQQAGKMATRPSMMLEFAHYLRDHWQAHYGVAKPQIFAEAYVSVNGRPYRHYLDPGLDLAAVNRTFFEADEWILPMDAGDEGADGATPFDRLEGDRDDD